MFFISVLLLEVKKHEEVNVENDYTKIRKQNFLHYKATVYLRIKYIVKKTMQEEMVLWSHSFIKKLVKEWTPLWCWAGIQVQRDSDCMEIETDFTSPLFTEEFHAELWRAADLEMISQV